MLIAVLFGSTLLGVLGALVAIPLAASIQILVREWWAWRARGPPGRDHRPGGPAAAGAAGDGRRRRQPGSDDEGGGGPGVILPAT